MVDRSTLGVLRIIPAARKDNEVSFVQLCRYRSFAGRKWRPEGKDDLGGSAVTSEDADGSFDMNGNLEGSTRRSFRFRDRHNFR